MAKQPGDGNHEADARGPSMTRSQAQIAMSYAPGQHFTFEGAAGACQAIPSSSATPARLDQTTRVQIEMRIVSATNPAAILQCKTQEMAAEHWFQFAGT